MSTIYTNIPEFINPKAILGTQSLSNIIINKLLPDTKISVVIEDVSKVPYYKQYNIDGTIKNYNIKNIICYRDKLFVAKRNTTKPPYNISSDWNEMTDIASRFDISTTKPKGLKRPGDRWNNPETSREYVYSKINDQYLWLSD